MPTCKVIRKFTDVQIVDLPLIASITSDPSMIAAFTYGIKPDVLYINRKSCVCKDEKFWDRYLVAVIAHEEVHIAMDKLGLPSETLDRLCSTQVKSKFLVDCDWKWLQK